MSWYTYVLRSTVNGRWYTGSTNNLERRLSEHNSGKTKSIAFTRPYIVVYQEEHKTRLEARRRELFLKTGKGREFLKTKLGS